MKSCGFVGAGAELLGVKLTVNTEPFGQPFVLPPVSV